MLGADPLCLYFNILSICISCTIPLPLALHPSITETLDTVSDTFQYSLPDVVAETQWDENTGEESGEAHGTDVTVHGVE